MEDNEKTKIIVNYKGSIFMPRINKKRGEIRLKAQLYSRILRIYFEAG